MDGPSFLRRAIIRGFIMESAGLVHALKDDEALETYIKYQTRDSGRLALLVFLPDGG
jgi:hypothetical protein